MIKISKVSLREFDKALDLIEANKEKIEQLEKQFNDNKAMEYIHTHKEDHERIEKDVSELRQLIKSEVDDMDSAEKHDVNMITRSIEELKEQLWQVRDELMKWEQRLKSNE